VRSLFSVSSLTVDSQGGAEMGALRVCKIEPIAITAADRDELERLVWGGNTA
jgi:hypothetical protein